MVEVGGALRALEHDGAPLLDGTLPAIWPAAGGAGACPLAEPGRRGAYRFGGRAIEAGERALQGRDPRPDPLGVLARRGPQSVALYDGARLRSQPAYPFPLDLRLEYSLGDGGLEVTLRASNPGDADLPFGSRVPPVPRARDGLG